LPISLDRVIEIISSHQPSLIPIEEAPQRAAVAVVLREKTTEPGIEVLFIRRVEHPDDPWSGHMAFPGGRVDPGESDPVDTAIREACEEVGLHLARDGRPIGRLDELRAMAKGKVLPLAIAPVVFVLDKDVPLTPQPEEVASFIWVGIDSLASGRHASTLSYSVSQRELILPCWRIGEHCIWGLTYHMTCNLLELLGVVDCSISEKRARTSFLGG